MKPAKSAEPGCGRSKRQWGRSLGTQQMGRKGCSAAEGIPDSRAARRLLVSVLGDLPEDVRSRLRELKAEAAQLRRRQDLVWFLLLDAMSTWGNSRGHDGLIKDGDNFQRVTFRVLKPLAPRVRRAQLGIVLRAAKVRMPDRKAEYLARNFDQIEALGGLAAVKKAMFDLKGRNAKIEFLRRFHGIGEKYARDCWMNLKDPDFEDCVALDVRVLRVERLLGSDRGGYAGREQSLVGLAHDAGLSGWELDRILYNYSGWVLEALKQQ